LRQKNAGDSVPVAIFRLARRDPRRYGGYIVHLGVALIAIGIIASWFFQSERQVIVAPGETVELAEYSITYTGLTTSQNSDSSTVTANLIVSKGGDERATMGAQRFFYRGFEDQPTTRVAVETVGFDDVYVMLLEWTDDQRANIRIFVNPLVPWIWAGGALYLFGMVVLVWPAPVVEPVRVTAPERGRLLGEATT
jgi:cytochrome c-type biogenesis protein CcmF